jgi:hypothetical protein
MIRVTGPLRSANGLSEPPRHLWIGPSFGRSHLLDQVLGCVIHDAHFCFTHP